MADQIPAKDVSEIQRFHEKKEIVVPRQGIDKINSTVKLRRHYSRLHRHVPG